MAEYFHPAWQSLIYPEVILFIEVKYMDDFFTELVNRARYYEQFEEFVRAHK